jgi:exopolysaccharide production protein ExoY
MTHDIAYDAVLSRKTNASHAVRREFEPVRRLLDLSLATIILILLAPLILLVAALIAAHLKSHPIYKHRRVGRDGQPFNCLKFRTMVRNADAVLAAYLAENPEAALQWQRNRKLLVDPRTTGLGRLLRVSSLDELPQLFNVLSGQMSLVGPRPITFDELERYGMHACHYMSMRPGVTGLWQVSGRSRTSYEERVALDASYFRDRSLSLDAWILFRTASAVIKTQNSA